MSQLPAVTQPTTAENENRPCQTIAHAIDHMTDGDTLLVDDGEYSTGHRPAAQGCRLHHSNTTHISLDASKSCPNNGCAILAKQNSTAHRVRLNGGRIGMSLSGADGWTFQGLKFEEKYGLWNCSSNGTTLNNTVHVITDSPKGSGQVANYVTGSRNIHFKNIQIYLEDKPCDIADGPNSGMRTKYAIANNASNNILIEDSYIGHVFQPISNSIVQGFTFRRNHLEHWMNHGIQMLRSKDFLIENNILGGTSRCTDEQAYGPRLIDIYEVDNMVVRNNTIVGHGSNPRSAMISYHAFGNTYASCELSPQKPGYCQYDKTISCDANDIPKIPGINYSAASSDCPQLDSSHAGTPGYPNQRCSGICHFKNIKFYNNIVHDLPANVGHAGHRYIDFEAGNSRWTRAENILFDGNYYSAGVEEWKCSGDGHTGYTMAEWRQGTCFDNHPDLQSIVGQCANHPATACGTDGDCPSGGCLKRAPQFLNYAADNYHAKNSDAIQVDAGLNGFDADGVAYCAAEDKDGKPRTDGKCDIGAFEW